MPVTRVIEVDDASDETLDVTDQIRDAILKHRGAARWLRAQRVSGRRARTPALPTRIGCEIIESDDAREVATDAAREIIGAINADADGDAWKGEVAILGEAEGNQRPPVLARIPVTFDAESTPKPTREGEITGVIGAMRETIAKMGDAVVRIANAKGLEHESIAKLVAEVADSQRKLSDSGGKWAYKMHKESEETAREAEREQGSAARSRHRWAAAETFAEEWKGVAEIWSKYFAANKGRAIPKRVTPDEIVKIFDAPATVTIDGVPLREVFDPIRAIVAEMVAEPNLQRRCAIAMGPLRAAINALSPVQRDVMKARIVSELGMERAEEIAAWLSLPIT